MQICSTFCGRYYSEWMVCMKHYYHEFFCTRGCFCMRASIPLTESQDGQMKCGRVWMILTSSPPAVSSSSTARILTGPLLFQLCVGSQGSHVLEIIHPRATADRGPRLWNCILRVCGLQDRALMKDSVAVERITNARLLHRAHFAHTRTCRDADQPHTPTHRYPCNTYTRCHATGSYSPDLRANGTWSMGVGGEMGSGRDGWVLVDWMDEKFLQILVHNGWANFWFYSKLVWIQSRLSVLAQVNIHTLGSWHLHRSLKCREDRSGEYVYLQVELGSLCGFIYIY